MPAADHYARSHLAHELTTIFESPNPAAAAAVMPVLTALEAEAGWPSPGRLMTHYAVIDEALELLDSADQASVARQLLRLPGTPEVLPSGPPRLTAHECDLLALAVLRSLGLIAGPRPHDFKAGVAPGRALEELDLPARHVDRRQRGAPSTIRELLAAWNADMSSNLCLVVGPFGAGKSHSVKEVFLQATQTAARTGASQPVMHTFGELLESIRSANPHDALTAGTLYVIDGYEEISLVGLGADEAADARPLKPLLDRKNKLLVASRKANATDSDELLDQLFDVTRHKQLGIRNPFVFEILPVATETAAMIADRNGRSSVVGTFFREAPEEQSAQLRRPLTLSMIIALDPSDIPTTGIGLSWLYEQYVRAAGSYDYDRNNSALPSAAKINILRRLAGDKFQPLTPTRSAHPSGSDVELRVSEEVAQNPNLRNGRERPSESWTTDFLETNHIFVQRRKQAGPIQTQTFDFVHSSFYEYFLALELLAKVSNDSSFGFFEDKFTARAFDSLLPGFMKALMTAEMEAHLSDMVRRKKLPHLDRLLGLYLLEDSAGVISLIRQSPQDYQDFLATRLETISSHFLSKAIRFQLIMLAPSDDEAIKEACDFVDYVSTVELDAEQDVETHVFGATTSPEQFLLGRFRNAELSRARPVFAFRLGQYGSRASQEQLEAISTTNKRYAKIIEEAIANIESRQPLGATTTGASDSGL